MEEDIKVLEEYKEKMIKDEKIHDDYRNMLTAIENLIEGYKELEEEVSDNAMAKEEWKARYNILIKDMIPKSKVREIIYPRPDNPIPLEIQNSEMYKRLKKLVEKNKELEDLHDEVKIIENREDRIEPINAYKLMESPWLADKLKEMNYDTFMEHLKRSEVEIVSKISEIIDYINKQERDK